MNEQVRVIKFTGKKNTKDNVPNMELRNRSMSKVFNLKEIFLHFDSFDCN